MDPTPTNTEEKRAQKPSAWMDFLFGVTPLPRPETVRDRVIEWASIECFVLGALLLAAGIYFLPRADRVASISIFVASAIFVACGLGLRRRKRWGLGLLYLTAAMPPAVYAYFIDQATQTAGVFVATFSRIHGYLTNAPWTYMIPFAKVGEYQFALQAISFYLLIMLPVMAYFTRRRLWFD